MGTFCESQNDRPIPISYPIPLDDFTPLDTKELDDIAEAYSDLIMDEKTPHFKMYQLALFWGKLLDGKGNPSNETIAKNCLLGFKQINVHH